MTQPAGFPFPPALFPFFFIAGWLVVTTILSVRAGWFALMRNYPDRPERAVLTLPRQSGSMGGVGMNGILTLSTCESGLRMHIMRIFGLFSRDFFVPWEEIAVLRKQSWLMGPTTELQFGAGIVGKLKLQAYIADRLARSVPARWPEAELLPPEPASGVFLRYLKLWLAVVVFASAFFTLVPRMMAHGKGGPPVAIAILFPAIVFGVVFLVRYLIEINASRSR